MCHGVCKIGTIRAAERHGQPLTRGLERNLRGGQLSASEAAPIAQRERVKPMRISAHKIRIDKAGAQRMRTQNALCSSNIVLNRKCVARSVPAG